MITLNHCFADIAKITTLRGSIAIIEGKDNNRDSEYVDVFTHFGFSYVDMSMSGKRRHRLRLT